MTRRQFGRLAAGLGIWRTAAALPPPPKLTVLLVLEQFRPDYVERARGQLGTGGLKLLLEGGTYFRDCRHTASAFTTTSVATLATGTWPSQHGIVADSWYDRGARRAVRASEDALLATTLVMEAAASARHRVRVAGLDAVTTRLFAGSSVESCYWMDDNGQFASSRSTPDWLAAYNRQKPLENLHNANWMAVGARSDAPPLRTLTWDPAHPELFLALYRSSPLAQMAQFEFAAELAAREQLGQGDTTDLLCLLLGSTARLGHETGARSPLMTQMVLELDRHLTFLIDRLNHLAGEGSYNVVLAAGHGAPVAPPPEMRARMAVSGEAVALAIQKVLGQGGARVDKYIYPFLWLDPGKVDSGAARAAAVRAALAVPAVAGYRTASGESSASGDWAARFHHSFHPQRSGDLMLSYRPDYVEEFGAGRGVSYGSLYNYDACVPLCFWGPQFTGGEIEYTVESVDVAPTLARALGLPAPSSSVGRVLTEAFAEPVKSKK